MSHSDPYRDRLHLAIDAALAAGRHIRFEAGRIDRSQISDKGIHDIVTHVDEACQALIIEMISAKFPEDQLLGEEGSSHSGTGDLAAGDFRWIIDPIDGTTNFANGVPPYAVSIGVQQGGAMAIGVVYEVTHDELFSASRGSGLMLNGRPCSVSAASNLGESLLTTGFPYRSFDHVDQYLEVFKSFMRLSRGVRRPGSASVDLAYVACGRYDGFFESGLQPWDVAAGCLLVEEGGGMITDFRGAGHPVYSAQVLASNGRIHDAMLSELDPMRDIRS